MTNLTTVDLFAGCGGLSLGFHLAGLDLSFAIEKDPMAFQTLEANFLSNEAPYKVLDRWPQWLERRPHTIEEVLNDETSRQHLLEQQGHVDVVCGGPPCQGFSIGGIRDGKDQRNVLPVHYLNFVRLVQPRAVILENVEGMTRKFEAKPGERELSFSDWLVEELEDAGYATTYRVIDASQYGVPQIRRRLILFGVQRAELHPWGSIDDFFNLLSASAEGFIESKGLDASRQVTVLEAIDDLNGTATVVCPDSPKFMAGTYKTPVSAYAKLMRRDIPDTQVPDSHRFSHHGARILEFYRRVQATQPFGRLSKSFLRKSGTKKDKKVLIDPGAPSSTITTHPDEFIHYEHPRNISVREMARLQSFPDDFQFKGRYTINGPRRRFDTARCSQVGNAVPPLLGEAIGIAIKQFLNATAEEVNQLREAKGAEESVMEDESLLVTA